MHTRLLKRAASYPEVERILVNPGIKKKLCDTVTGDRSWLRKIRPFWGHDYHFHIRIGCQPGSPNCKGQEATPDDDGCGKPLAWWFTEEPWRPNKNPDAPKARDLMTMANLPKQCQCRARRAGSGLGRGRRPITAARVPIAASGAGTRRASQPIARQRRGGLPSAANAFTATPGDRHSVLGHGRRTDRRCASVNDGRFATVAVGRRSHARIPGSKTVSLFRLMR